MCVNGKEDAKLKSLKKYSLTYLGDSLHFKIAVSAFFSLWISAIDIMNCFENTMKKYNIHISTTVLLRVVCLAVSKYSSPTG